MINIPNMLTVFRLVSIPVLIALAWRNQHDLFLILLTASLVTDALDGFIARKLHQTTEFGTRLDSIADFITYTTVPILTWYLWPDIIRREAPFVIAVFVSTFVPVMLGLIKYGRLPCYHTWLAKLSAMLMGSTCLVLFATGIAWPFHVATPFLFVTAFEEIAITALLPEWRANVPSLWHARRLARTLTPADRP